MGMEDVRGAFLSAGRGALRLHHASLQYRDSGQVLSFTGWHADDTPFAMVTAPFGGDPGERACRVAEDLIRVHDGEPVAAPPAQFIPPKHREQAMSQKGSGLARLMTGLQKLDDNADALANRLEQAMAGLNAEMVTTQQVVANVEGSVSDLRAVNKLYSNGAGPTSDGSSGPSLQSPAKPAE